MCFGEVYGFGVLIVYLDVDVCVVVGCLGWCVVVVLEFLQVCWKVFWFGGVCQQVLVVFDECLFQVWVVVFVGVLCEMLVDWQFEYGGCGFFLGD